MRWLLALLAFSGCGGTVAPDETDATSGPLEIRVDDPRFVYCECHHGFGPGIDGTVRVTIRNPGAGKVHVASKGVALIGSAMPVVYATQGPFPPIRPIAGRAFIERDVAPGESVSGIVTATIDPGSNPWPPNGTYAAAFDLEVGGTLQRVTSETSFLIDYRPYP
jgi:hypothetical protein